MVEFIFAFSYSLVTTGLLYFFLKKSLATKLTLKKNILWWWLFGFVFNFYSFTWLYTVYPLIWMPPGFIQLLGIFIIHLSVSLVASLGFMFVGWLTHIQTKAIYKPFLFGMGLVFAEIIRSFLLSVLFKGEGSTIDLHYTSGTIGNALAPTPLIEFAYFGGTFALTFILGYLVYIFVTKINLSLYQKHLAAILVLLGIVHFFIPTSLPENPVTIGVVTTDFKTVSDENLVSSFKEQNKKVSTMTFSFASSSPDILVYPEDTRYIEYASNTEKKNLTTFFPKTLFIDGNTNTFKGKMVNVSVFYHPETGKNLARGKSFLLPFNEFIPIFFRPIFSLFIPENAMGAYSKNHTYTPIQSNKTVPFNDIRIGTLLCSEILSFATINNLRKEKPSLVFFQSHLNVFHNNPWFRMHLYSFTKIAAAQLRSPLISSTNGAPSFIISPYGVIVDTIPTSFSTRTYTFSR